MITSRYYSRMASPLLPLAAAAARLLPAPLKQALYKLGPVSRALREGLNRAAPDGLSVVEVAGGALRGARLMLDLQEEKDYWLGTYEMDLQRAATDWLKARMVVYDLGANIGYFSLLAARHADESRVYAFEALPANIERLQSNIALNPNLEPIEVIPKAVAAKNGESSFLVHASGGMGKLQGSSGRQADYLEEIQVETLALDDFVYAERHAPPDLIKMDIEGGEGPALKGMARLLKEIRPILLIELHGPEAAQAAWQQLNEADYSLHRLGRNYPRIAGLDDLDWKSYVLGKPHDA